MNSLNKVAFFDFCETLVSFQTAMAYVGFVHNHTSSIKCGLKWFIFRVIRKLRLFPTLESISKGRILEKRCALWTLRGLEYNFLDNVAEKFYHKMLKPNIIPELYTELKNRQLDEFDIFIVSGGYDIYIKYFAMDNNIDVNHIISSRLNFEQGAFTGEMVGLDCMAENKVTLIEGLFKKNEIYSVAYSDSISDLPLLLWVNEGYVVSRGRKWVQDNSLNQVFWNDFRQV